MAFVVMKMIPVGNFAMKVDSPKENTAASACSSLVASNIHSNKPQKLEPYQSSYL